MQNVIEIFQRRRVFSIEDADSVIQLIYRITQDHYDRVQKLIDRLEALNGKNAELVLAVEEDINEVIQSWQGKIEKLGACPKGLWIVDFDGGDGYYCWKYPEKSIEYWHSYEEGFSARVPIHKKSAQTVKQSYS